MNADIIDKAIQCSKEIFEDHIHNHNHENIFLAILDKMGIIGLWFTDNFCMDNNKNYWLCLDDLNYEMKFLSIWIIHKC